MPSALIIGGTGQIGVAVAEALTLVGWDVRLASRSAPDPALPFEQVQLAADDPNALAKALGSGVDLLMDCVAFDAADADRLLGVQGNFGRLVAISSASVYRDDQGLTLDEAFTKGFPTFPIPIPEDHPTVTPGPATYSTRKIAMEQRLLELPRYELFPELVEELEAFEYSISDAGNVKSSAPSGQHDDTVVALALAVWELRPGRPMPGIRFCP